MKRLTHTLLILLLMSFVTFMLIGMMPGDPIDLMIAGNPKMTPEDAAHLRTLYGLDQPLTLRYLHWLKDAAQGDFGYSRTYGLPVLAVIGPRMAASGLLMGLSLLLTVALAVPAGVYAAVRPRGKGAALIAMLGFIGLSMPAFWAGLLLICLFAVDLNWLPAMASGEHAASLVMPVVTLALGGFALYSRHTRAMMADALTADHIRTARAKGCGTQRVIWRHAFSTALPPLVTLLMLDLGTLLGGALTVETVFAYPGMGKLMFDAVMGNDYNLALIGFLCLTACILLANLAADILYARLDPRVRAAA